MPHALTAHQVFLSTVSDDFEKAGASFPGLRSRLRFYLSRAQGQKAVAQEEFPQVQASTVQKLDDLLRPCGTVLHLVGGNPGAVPSSDEVLAYLDEHPDFLKKQPALLAALGDFSGVSYTQWEAFIALHYGRSLFVYTSPHASAQQAHLDRLKLAAPKKYASPFKDEADLLGQLIGDLHTQLPALAGVVKPRLSPPRFIRHAAEHFLGREPQLEMLDNAWADGTNVISIIAWGGVGKTALITEWVQSRFIKPDWKTADGQPALLAYFDWSFYDQGTRSLDDSTEARAGSVGDFFEQALVFFGDPDPNLPGKGRRLADLIRQQRSLIILDGLEPLQQPPGHSQAGRLLDPDLNELLRALAIENPGLCLITSREPLKDLDGLKRSRYCSHDLEDLPVEVAIQLLRQFDITGGDAELAVACEKFCCHALSLTLLGRYLSDAHDGDIRRLDRMTDIKRADTLTRPDRRRSIWRILENYEAWLSSAEADGNPKTLAVLRLTGLFDRPATADCLAALRVAPVIPGLTDAIHGMADDEWNILLKRLERAHLIKLRCGEERSSIFQSRDQHPQSAPPQPPHHSTLESRATPAIDAHPLIREYFAQQLKQTQPDSFKAAHSRLFDHLCEIAPECTQANPEPRWVNVAGMMICAFGSPLPTLEDLKPLYQAVVHGCLADRAPEACEKVFHDRILRGSGNQGNYSMLKLGAAATDLGAISAFFEKQWSHALPMLSAKAQEWLLNEAASRLLALGQIEEAAYAMQASISFVYEGRDLHGAATAAGNFSELRIILGQLNEAETDGRRAMLLADQSLNDWQRFIQTRTTAAGVLLQAGERVEARELFEASEQSQARNQHEFPMLSSLGGFRYSELLLDPCERVVWAPVALRAVDHVLGCGPQKSIDRTLVQAAISVCQEIQCRAKWCIETNDDDSLRDTALGYLTYARTQLYESFWLRARERKPSALR